jgi:glucose-6-phosphate isomerase
MTEPLQFCVEPSTGHMTEASRRYVKRFSELAGLYADGAAYQAMLPALGGSEVYEVWEYTPSEATGDLIFGTSVMRPGLVGEEFFLTRGHRHALVSRSEIYYCQAGSGVMLMESPQGTVRALPMVAQSIVYVPPHWIHRSVNIGADRLVTVFCYAADAGQDYDVIAQSGGMRMRVVRDGAGGWKLVDNPAWQARE